MNLKVFKKRLRTLYSSWIKHKRDLWSDSDILLICTPPSSDDDDDLSFHPISSSFYQWLLGFNFPNTIAIFMRKEIHFISTNNKVPLLRTLITSTKESIGSLLTIHQKPQGDDDGCKLLVEILRNSSIRKAPIIIGHVAGESPMQKIQSNWSIKNPNGFESVVINNGLLRLCTVIEIEEHKDGKMDLGFKGSRDEDKGLKTKDSRVRSGVLYMRPIPKKVEEKILMAEVTEMKENTKASLSEEDCKVKSFNGVDDWFLV